MKKLLRLSTLIAALGISLAFAGCSNPVSDSGTDETQTTSQQDNESEEDTTTPTSAGENNSANSLGYIQPPLPDNVGEDPFKGNTYADDDDHVYTFGTDNTVLYSLKQDDGSTIPVIKYRYSYNANTNIMTVSWIAYNKYGSGLLPYLEFKNYFIDFFHTQEPWSESNNQGFATIEEYEADILEWFETCTKEFSISKNWYISLTDTGCKLAINDVYAPEELVLANLSDISLKYYKPGQSTSESPFVFFSVRQNGNKYISLYYNGENDFFTNEYGNYSGPKYFKTTEITDSTIKATLENNDGTLDENIKIILNYSLSPQENYVCLTFSSEDTTTKRILEFDETTTSYVLDNSKSVEDYLITYVKQ